MAWPTDSELHDLGYHKTITRAYLVLLTQFARTNPDWTVGVLAQALLSSGLAKRDALFSTTRGMC